MGAKRDPAAADAPVFQDPLFSTQRTVQRTLANGTVLRLRPLPGSRVQVLTYTR